MKKISLIFTIILFSMLSACANLEPTESAETQQLAFAPKITMFEPGTMHFELGIANQGEANQSMVRNVNIRAVVTNDEGKIRNQMTIVDLSPIAAGETSFPLTYEAVYDPGQYVLSISGEGIPSLSIDFEVRESDGVLKLAAHPKYIDPHTGFTIDEIGQ